MSQLHQAEVEVSVLIQFFNRPQMLKKVFEQVKKARPSKLFLYQDGPREGRQGDVENIQACRAVVEAIEWECEVHKLYQEKNLGCDPSGYMSRKWAFSLTDKCIILEDDVLVSISFFRFAKELLDRYENDERITMIAGMNHEEITTRIDGDYFFTSNISIWGWATWKRVINRQEADYRFLDNDIAVSLLKNLIKTRGYRNDYFDLFYKHKSENKPYFETVLISDMLLNSGLSIVPAKNMCLNIGNVVDSTHFTGDDRYEAEEYKKLFTMKCHEVEFPLKHPDYVIENVHYIKRVYRIMCWNLSKREKAARVIRRMLRRVMNGDFNGIVNAVRRRL